MPHRTAPPHAEAEVAQAPPDIATMRAATRRLLAEDAAPIPAEEVDTLLQQLRGHIDLMIPEVEAAAGRMPKDDIPRYCALACIGEARRKMSLQPSPTPGGTVAHARRLARVVNALADHYSALNR